MGMIEEALSAAVMFTSLSNEAIEAFSPYWTRRDLSAEDTLWSKGDPPSEMALVVSGQLRVRVDGVFITKVGPGELIGEASLFLEDSVRTADVIPDDRCTIICLSRDDLGRLRVELRDTYAVLLSQALLALTGRVRNIDQKIRTNIDGNVEAPVRTESGLLAKMWKKLRPGKPPAGAPSLKELLVSQPRLAGASAEVVSELAAAFKLQALEEGEVVFLEGDEAASAYLIADGAIDVLRHVRGKKAERLAELGTGILFGVNSLIDGGARSASCVAVKPSWVYRMDAVSYAALTGEAELLFNETILASLRYQIQNANSILSRVKLNEAEGVIDRKGLSDEEFDNLLLASGFLEGASVFRKIIQDKNKEG